MRQTLGSPVLAPQLGRTQRLERDANGRAEREKQKARRVTGMWTGSGKGDGDRQGGVKRRRQHRFSSRSEKRKNKKERVKQRGRKGKAPKKPKTER